ncbi:hypothetical protein [Umezakia ovalisporum]|uniref:Uncharacterized protein n=1 Tax=Umezakia ovalisporum FSS-43 TaxID=2740520 RepID=A0ABT6K3V7_9CYAN|nr:hypothetical protein [Umezakia ovalisporum]MDH6056670.1 hypothetical protein [Umezakia ovalisporum FSS-43]MDH6068626.1 hypothetical protein [Umezakia ovalisporum APH033B]MDH6070148.1 hypothetical protein [Umezakia ovalisporum CobakiLakeA]MDH6077757.1 hypothetical protein [Umezakia ovalisporum FSS-45]MDH6079877.1 hypothetical protein [Umezakia ovalisporum FSS-44]
MNKPDQITDNKTNFLVEKQKEEEVMHDVLLLLQNLISREETTVKLVLDSLYDVGSINLINHKFRSGTLNTTLKFISRTSKPIFRIFAWRWFKNNGSQLITNWLASKITFTTKEKPKPQLVLEHPEIKINSVTKPQYQLQEVKHLRSQVTLLTGILAGVVTMLGGSFVWLGYSLERSHMQRIVELQTQVKTLEASVNEPESKFEN